MKKVIVLCGICHTNEAATGGIICDECFQASERDFASSKPPDRTTDVQTHKEGESGKVSCYDWKVIRRPTGSIVAEITFNGSDRRPALTLTFANKGAIDEFIELGQMIREQYTQAVAKQGN